MRATRATRQRYTAGHELGHHAFHHAAAQDLDLETELRRGYVDRWPDREKEAEAFGAWFLMPRRLVRHGLQELGIKAPRDPFDVYALSLWLGTSYTATARQLATTRIIDQATSEQWARVAPAELKQALAGERAPTTCATTSGGLMLATTSTRSRRDPATGSC